MLNRNLYRPFGTPNAHIVTDSISMRTCVSAVAVPIASLAPCSVCLSAPTSRSLSRWPERLPSQVSHRHCTVTALALGFRKLTSGCCGVQCTCKACAGDVMAGKDAACPICRTSISHLIAAKFRAPDVLA